MSAIKTRFSVRVKCQLVHAVESRLGHVPAIALGDVSQFLAAGCVASGDELNFSVRADREDAISFFVFHTVSRAVLAKNQRKRLESSRCHKNGGLSLGGWCARQSERNEREE